MVLEVVVKEFDTFRSLCHLLLGGIRSGAPVPLLLAHQLDVPAYVMSSAYLGVDRKPFIFVFIGLRRHFAR